jgi:hypothetical protein
MLKRVLVDDGPAPACLTRPYARSAQIQEWSVTSMAASPDGTQNSGVDSHTMGGQRSPWSKEPLAGQSASAAGGCAYPQTASFSPVGEDSMPGAFPWLGIRLSPRTDGQMMVEQ